MGDRLGTPGVVGFSFHSETTTSCKKDVRPVRLFFLEVRKHDSANFCVAFFVDESVQPHPRRNPESDEESMLTLISVTI